VFSTRSRASGPGLPGTTWVPGSSATGSCASRRTARSGTRVCAPVKRGKLVPPDDHRGDRRREHQVPLRAARPSKCPAICQPRPRLRHGSVTGRHRPRYDLQVGCGRRERVLTCRCAGLDVAATAFGGRVARGRVADVDRAESGAEHADAVAGSSSLTLEGGRAVEHGALLLGRKPVRNGEQCGDLPIGTGSGALGADHARATKGCS